LPHLGFDGVTEVRVGKCIRFVVDSADEDSAQREVNEMCARFLANPVIEDSTVRIEALVS
jgi:phosphoribosylformylglycinamidine synthase